MPVRNVGALARTKTLELGPELTQEQLDNGEERLSVTVKYADTRAFLARQNLFAAVRYITEDADGKTATERSFPMGDLRLSTIRMVLTGWNIRFNKDADPAPINEKNIVDLMLPEEIEELYNAIIDMNPVWNNNKDDEEGD